MFVIKNEEHQSCWDFKPKNNISNCTSYLTIKTMTSVVPCVTSYPQFP